MSLFYRYDKEGPGVRKNEPEKRTFVRFFSTLFGNAWKLFPTSFVFWVLFGLPLGVAVYLIQPVMQVVREAGTEPVELPGLPAGRWALVLLCLVVAAAVSGLSFAGMTGVARTAGRGKHTFGLADFFRTVAKNWKQALPVGLLNSFVMTALLCAVVFYSLQPGVFGILGLGISGCLILTFAVMLFFVWFQVITFDMKLSVIYRNSFKFASINLKNNVIILLSFVGFWALFVLLNLLIPSPLMAAITVVVLLFFYPSFRFLLIQFGTFESLKTCLIDPYYKEHPDADIELRRNLGLDVGDDPDPDFTDLM